MCYMCVCMYTHNGILPSHLKERNNAICSNIDEIIILSEDGERQISHNIAYMQNLKEKDTNELIYKTETLTDLENKLMITRGKGVKREKLGIRD